MNVKSAPVPLPLSSLWTAGLVLHAQPTLGLTEAPVAELNTKSRKRVARFESPPRTHTWRSHPNPSCPQPKAPTFRQLCVRRIFPYLLLLALIAGLRTTVGAESRSPLLNDLGRAAERWVKDHVDRDALNVLTSSDQERVRTLFNDINRRLESTNVYALAPLKDTAARLLPLLKRSKNTRAYAEWLENHLDYLQVSDALRRAQTPPRPGATPPPPTSEAQRTAWDKQLENRPIPAAAQTYVPRLKPLFAERGTPPSLVWLAEVESSFNPQARSPAGAVGLFQFMPATARSLGLALTPQDERLHPDRSGQAAATYLAYLHRRFADWRLALAAYNAGETRVNTLLVQHKTRDYAVIAPRLPAETQLYVPKMEAVLRKRENVELTALTLARNGTATSIAAN